VPEAPRFRIAYRISHAISKKCGRRPVRKRPAHQASGERTSFRASSTLDKYVNQTTTLTGKMIVMNGSKIFRPETATPVSNTCGTSQ
jgi:hypothetical protein